MTTLLMHYWKLFFGMCDHFEIFNCPVALKRGEYQISQIFSSLDIKHLRCKLNSNLLYSWSFSRYSAPIHWLVHRHMTSNNETVSAQMP